MFILILFLLILIMQVFTCTRNSPGKFDLLSGLYLKQIWPPVLIFPKIEDDLDFDLILIWVVEMIWSVYIAVELALEGR